jgi:hypothetical protein
LRWVFLTTLVIVGRAVAALAIYSLGWHDTGSANDHERAQAQLGWPLIRP